MKHYETNHLADDANYIGSTFYLRINFVCMKKTAKTHRDNKAIQRNIEWLNYKTRLFKNRALRLIEQGKLTSNLKVQYFPKKYSFRRCIRRLAVDRQVAKEVSSKMKNIRYR